MRVVQTTSFAKAIKKLHKNHKTDVDAAVRAIMADPALGEAKVGDLAGVRVYKFRMVGQLCLLAYTYEEEILTLTLLALGSHENFYSNAK